ncbi:hypothetical protein JL475_24480 [Streptomyces sp. M2CJ-2]|uniref:hypothetical protein n=1 Tax=Streptomyces sp. M2CJ-2 TaxID=2803948 RepID=UPI0019254F02|nr:hypothetical protein [Streptomyces sp. M2CJ-2]MBL3669093.1 hypothetical protein [Streptomyces sp. M2CJ-2]
MSAAALAALPAAPHTQPQPAATGAHPRAGGLTIKVPLRLVVGAQYPDAALSVYVKIAALALREEGCTARVTTLAEYLGMSKSAVERGLKSLRNPDPIDGLTEVPTVRRTASGGTGESAHRVTRPLTEGELWVRIPVRAAEALTPRLLRLYALLVYATTRRIPVTAAELGDMLHHHTGKKAGECLGERQARRLVDDLETTGWLTVHRREGQQGRHAYETHRHPLHAVPAPAPADSQAPAAAEALEDQAPVQLALWGDEAPVIHDGSGPDLGDGSLASKEDHLIDRPDETKGVGVTRRRRGDRKWVAAPVDNSTVPDTFGPSVSRAARGNRPIPAPNTTPTGDSPGGYTGPELRWTARIHTALAPVRHELNDVRRFVLRRIAREIGAQLDTGISPDRMAARIRARYRTTMRSDIRDVGAWLLSVGIVHRGCGVPSCEDGHVWPTGEPCEICAQQRQVQRAQWREARELEDRLQQLRAERAAAAGGQEQPGLPAKKTFRQRDAASDEEIRAAIAERGPEIALHIYGHYRVLPLLAALPDSTETGSDRRTHHAQ